MNAKKRSALLVIRIVTDLTMVTLGWVGAYYLRFEIGLDAPLGVPDPWLYFKLIPFIAIIWFLVLSINGFYRRTMRRRSAFLEGLDILQSCALATLAFIAWTYFYEEYRYSRVTLVIFAVIHPMLLITGRSLVRKALRFYRRNATQRGILLIGSGKLLPEALKLATATEIDHCTVLGVVLVGNEEDKKNSEQFCAARKLKIFSTPENWTDFFVHENIHSVYLAVPFQAYGFIEKYFNEICNQVYDVKVVPDLLQYSKFAASIDIYQGVPVISIQDSPLEGLGTLLKRVMDFILAGFAAILFSPVLAVIATLVKITSRGPVLFRQERMGLDGKVFACLKFRTMPISAESQTGPVWATKEDTRATPFGKFLRKFSLDELPQLFNILRGDMSFVGPRPERPVFVQDFRKKIPGYMLRHKVKAGLTGWAQVHGWRGNTSLEKRIEYDLYYIKNWSLMLDIRIILMTARELLFSKNAY